MQDIIVSPSVEFEESPLGLRGLPRTLVSNRDLTGRVDLARSTRGVHGAQISAVGGVP